MHVQKNLFKEVNMIKFIIFNQLSGRYLADWESGDYLIFTSTFLARLYIQKKKLNPKWLEVRRMVRNDLP
jgi:hypothetical protein